MKSFKSIQWQAPTADHVNHVWVASVGEKLIMGDKRFYHVVKSITDKGDYYEIEFDSSKSPIAASKKFVTKVS